MPSAVDRSGRRLRIAAAIALAGLLAACGDTARDEQATQDRGQRTVNTGAGPPAAGPATSQATLADLVDLGDLQRRFNEDAGVTRLILLLSPT